MQLVFWLGNLATIQVFKYMQLSIIIYLQYTRSRKSSHSIFCTIVVHVLYIYMYCTCTLRCNALSLKCTELLTITTILINALVCVSLTCSLKQHTYCEYCLVPQIYGSSYASQLKFKLINHTWLAGCDTKWWIDQLLAQDKTNRTSSRRITRQALNILCAMLLSISFANQWKAQNTFCQAQQRNSTTKLHENRHHQESLLKIASSLHVCINV